VVRGSLENVAQRFLTVANEPGVGALVRICADSPFSDPALVDAAVQLFWCSGADLVTTSNPRTTPPGLSVEVLAAAPFRACYTSFQEAADFEHVTRAYYRNRAQYRIVSFAPAEPIALDCSLAIDTPADLARARRVARQLGARMLVEAPAWQIAQRYRQLESGVELETETAAVCVPE
jgi:spore coat polysaccharide biosynthesis protein SpsF